MRHSAAENLTAMKQPSALLGHRLTLKRSDISLRYILNICLQGLTVKGGGGGVFPFKVISVYQLSLFANETKQYKIRIDVVVHVKKVIQTFSGLREHGRLMTG